MYVVLVLKCASELMPKTAIDVSYHIAEIGVMNRGCT